MAQREDEIIHQGPGFTIARSFVPGTMTHYGAVVRPDGSERWDFVDLRDRPDLVDSIPEVQRSPAIARALRALNAPNSPLFSIGCECHEFNLSELRHGHRFQVGGFVDATFRSFEKATAVDELINLAAWTLNGVGTPEGGEVICYEFIVEPMKYCHGRDDCFCVMFKSIGYGDSSEAAWKAFEVAATGVAVSLERLTA